MNRFVVLACVSGALGLGACFGGSGQSAGPKVADPTLARLAALGAGPRCPAPIARSASSAYYYIIDDEYDLVGGGAPPSTLGSERSRGVLRAHPEVAARVHAQFGLERYVELSGPGRSGPASAAAEDPDGGVVQATLAEKDEASMMGGAPLYRMARRAVVASTTTRGGIVGESAPEGSKLGLVFLEERVEGQLGLTVVATLEGGGGRALQAGRRLRHQETLIYSTLKAPGLLDAFERQKRDMSNADSAWNLPGPMENLAALLAADALFELCIAEHVRSGNLTAQDFPLPLAEDVGSEAPGGFPVRPSSSP